MPAVRAQREQLVDALRGAALFGILAVNIQCYVTGLNGSPLGILTTASSSADHAAVWLTAFLFQFKFYPIFCFCFGYGFALQTRAWIAAGADARLRFGRRTDFMFGMGFLHGALLWFGDILTGYAVAGKVLANHIGKGPRRLLPVLKFWGIVLLAVAIPFTAVVSSNFAERDAVGAIDRAELSAGEAKHTLGIYTNAGYLDATAERISDYLTIVFAIPLILPEMMVLMILGAMAAQLGLLRRRQRYRRLWWRVLAIGLAVGVPINIWFAIAQYRQALNPWRSPPLWQVLPDGFAPLLAAAFVAAAVLASTTTLGQGAIRLFAPAGRLALSHYLAQSLLMALLLTGFGLRLGASLTQSGLLLLALALYLALLMASHWMSRHGIGGWPEALWRRHTMADAAGSNAVARRPAP